MLQNLLLRASSSLNFNICRSFYSQNFSSNQIPLCYFRVQTDSTSTFCQIPVSSYSSWPLSFETDFFYSACLLGIQLHFKKRQQFVFSFVVRYMEFMLSLVQDHFNLSLNDIFEHVLSHSQVLVHYYCADQECTFLFYPYFSLLRASEDLNWYHIKRKGETLFSYKLHCAFTDPQQQIEHFPPTTPIFFMVTLSQFLFSVL